MFLYLVVGISSLSIIGFYSYYKAKNVILNQSTEKINFENRFSEKQVENFYNQALKPIRNLRNDLIFVSISVLILIFSIALIGAATYFKENVPV